MRLPGFLQGDRARWALKALAFNLMIGFFLGYIFFHDIFYYVCSPINSDIPLILILLLVGMIGFITGYLFPDPRVTIAFSFSLPILGAFFCFLLYISPTLSPDILGGDMFGDLFAVLRLTLANVIMVFLTLFVTSFFSLYYFDAEYQTGDPEA